MMGMSQKESLASWRDQQRIAMIFHTKRDRFGHPLCHLCNERPGSQMHELINRAQLSSNKEGLRICFRHELCSWLCPECHSVAPTKENEDKLWLRNVVTYSWLTVYAYIAAVEKVVGFNLGIVLPRDPNEVTVIRRE